MYYRDVCKILGLIVFGFTLALIIPLIIAFYYQFLESPEIHPQPHSFFAFVWSILLSIVFGGVLYYLGRHSKGSLYRREALFVVVAVWLIIPMIAAFPFLFSGTLKDPWQAYFESVSGFTTTGSSVLAAKKYNSETGKEEPIVMVVKGVIDTEYVYYGTVNPVRDPKTEKILYEGIEAVSKAVLFWRTFIQWLGGMGIIVLFVAVLPALGVGGKQLFYTEAPGPVKESLTPRIKETALNLWKIYVGITILEVIAILYTNPEIPIFDVVNITFATLATGGFSIKNASIGAYESVSLEWIVILFMFLGSINFSLYYYCVRGKFWRLNDPELIIYICLIFGASALTTFFLVNTEQGSYSLFDVLRKGTFQIISAQTTTGFTTADYDKWPYSAQITLLLVMCFGGMAGSTSGGIKTVRLYMLFRIAQHRVETLFRPEAVRAFAIGGGSINVEAAIRVLIFFLVLASFSTLGTLLLVFDGVDLETAFSTVVCCINNVGISFRAAGPLYSFAFMSDFGLIITMILMIMGRLEFLAVLAILVPAFWKKGGG
jgi:trk system potassium uptake protein TrkH